MNGTTAEYAVLSLPSMMKMGGHSWLSILKIDIEGAEFDVIDSWHRKNYNIPANQLLFEFHERFFRAKSKAMGVNFLSLAISKLKDLGFVLVCHTNRVRCKTICAISIHLDFSFPSGLNDSFGHSVKR